MPAFANINLPPDRTDVAPDGSDVRVLLGLPRGGMAHFELAARQVSRAVVHRNVDEIWYIVSGQGEMWRSQGGREEFVELRPGLCLTIPVGTSFQFRTRQAVAVVGITMPPWPGPDEAMFVTGPWVASV